MKICIIGRTAWLLEAGRRLVAAGHRISVVVTAKQSNESGATADDFHSFADATEAPFFRSIDASREDILACVKSSGARLALTMNYPGILDARFCGLFQDGVVNCHGSLLPRYRGNSPPNWGILAGDDEVGLTLHRVVPGELDNGDILLQRPLKLSEDMDIGDVYRWLDAAVPAAFIDLVSQVESGSVSGVPQDETLASYAFPRRPEDARLRFCEPVETLLRLIRASSRPFSGAFCFFEGRERVTVWRAERAEAAGAILAVPGQVLRVDDAGRPVVWAADGAIRLLDFNSDSPLIMTRRSRFA